MRVALVTGGARRIGAEICRSLMADGWFVLIHCRNSIDEAKKLAATGSGDVVQADLSSSDDIGKLIAEEIDFTFCCFQRCSLKLRFGNRQTAAADHRFTILVPLL